MSKALANPKLFAATGILFAIATMFNVLSGVTPEPKLGATPAVKTTLPMQTGISPVPLPEDPTKPGTVTRN